MNIDLITVAVFLALTLFIGLGHGRKAKSIKEYSIGSRDFTTTQLVATLVATKASGSGFFITLSRTYSDGL